MIQMSNITHSNMITPAWVRAFKSGELSQSTPKATFRDVGFKSIYRANLMKSGRSRLSFFGCWRWPTKLHSVNSHCSLIAKSPAFSNFATQRGGYWGVLFDASGDTLIHANLIKLCRSTRFNHVKSRTHYVIMPSWLSYLRSSPLVQHFGTIVSIEK